MQSLAFLCLGTMGYPMAGHLARAGHRLTVWNRSRARAEAWAAEFGGIVAATPAEAVRAADVVFCCTGDDADLRAVVCGEHGAFAGMRAAAIFVDHTTVSAAVSVELASEAEPLGIRWLDAPVSGGQAGAENGALSVMLGGDAEAYRAVEPLLDCYAKKTLRLGPVGSGQRAKMVNQICIAGLVQALSEGLEFARRAGLDAHQVVEVISQGAAQSWQMDNRAATMLDGRFDFGFAVDWMRKDLTIALEEARRIGAPLPVTELVDSYYAELQATGSGRLDTSSLITRLTRPPDEA
ncbi:MAG: NAD(P)-dependent oxidoreductase [Deltaproteobacteria bacterium]|nr:NAD(P)-dependent oxidoreductase [Deltaproteobacteria bacterium]MBW2399419.1 NAD(P)-dependent oxidoreductase [Deltaproteobacteria bacterium]